MSGVMQRLLESVDRVASSDVSVLLLGETGTGKELIAHRIHTFSYRQNQTFVPVNCAALPESIFEAEMFGYRKGAFTGADQDRPGLFEAADGGTLFLDEIGELALGVQGRLLRVLDGGEVRRLGDSSSRQTNVRIIAATHRDLAQQVRERTFREDLYYRIRTVVLRVPPLREHKEDIPHLVDRFLQLSSMPKAFEIAAIDRLQQHDWPGNIRQLKNVVDACLVMARETTVKPSDVEASISDGSSCRPEGTSQIAPEVERLSAALSRNKWSRQLAARDLGVSRSTLWRKLKRCGIVLLVVGHLPSVDLMFLADLL